MALVLQNNLLFIHVPKTGGVYITEYLEKSGIATKIIADPFESKYNLTGAHIPPHLLSEEYSNYRKFAFIRHPLSWYKSYYAYHVVRGWFGDQMIHRFKTDNFRDFIDFFLQGTTTGFLTELVEFYRQGGIDYWGRQEHLCEDLAKILRRENLFNTALPLPTDRKNISFSEALVYLPAQEDEILKRDAEIIREFYT